MSRKHCRFLVFESAVYVEDFGSRNSTRVNRAPLRQGKKRKLAINDVVEFGRRRWVLTNQNRFPPGNLDDKTSHSSFGHSVYRRDDGSLTSQISGFILNQTKILLSPGAYRKLQVREFARLRGWDFSTLLVVSGGVAVWVSGLVQANQMGAFAPNLRHSAVTLMVKFLLIASLHVTAMGLGHYVWIRRRHRNPVVRVLFVPASWLAGLLLLLPIELVLSAGREMAENVTQYVCLDHFVPASCRRFANENWYGFQNLPSEMKQTIIEKITLQP